MRPQAVTVKTQVYIEGADTCSSKCGYLASNDAGATCVLYPIQKSGSVVSLRVLQKRPDGTWIRPMICRNAQTL